MIGTKEIRIKFELDSIVYDKTLNIINYAYENEYSKKILRVRRNIRTGTRKQVYKGNEKEYKFTLMFVTSQEWEDFYSLLKDQNNIKYYPHVDTNYPYECYCDKIEFSLLDGNSEMGKIDFVFKSNTYKDLRVPDFIFVNSILTSDGVLIGGRIIE